MQQLNPSEISDLIRAKIQNLALSADIRTQGTVVTVTDGICRIHGLADAMQGEMLEFPNNTFGLALNLGMTPGYDGCGSIDRNRCRGIATKQRLLVCQNKLATKLVRPAAFRCNRFSRLRSSTSATSRFDTRSPLGSVSTSRFSCPSVGSA